MDIDTAPPSRDHTPSMHLDIPADDVMMEVDEFATPAPPPAPSSPVVPRAAEAAPSTLRQVPTPPSVQISASDAPACPRVKLDELFVRFMSTSDSKSFLSSLLEDARTGKDIANTPAYCRAQHGDRNIVSPASQLPGSPVSRLMSAHTPLGEVSPRSPIRTQSGKSPNAAILSADLDLGRSGTELRGPLVEDRAAAMSPTAPKPSSDRAPSPGREAGNRVARSSASAESSPRTAAVTIAEAIAEQKDSDKVAPMQQEPKIIANTVVTQSQSPLLSVDADMASDSSLESKSHQKADADAEPAGALTDTMQSADATINGIVSRAVDLASSSQLASAPLGAELGAREKELSMTSSTAPTTSSSVEIRSAPAGMQVQSTKAVTSSSVEVASAVSVGDGTHAKSIDAQSRVPEAMEQSAFEKALPHKKDVDDSDAKMDIQEPQHVSRTRPPLQATSVVTSSDTKMTEVSDKPPMSRSKAIPRFYFPCGRDAEERERRERETIREFFFAQRTQKQLDGATRTDIAELVVEVVGVPSYFASLIFTRIVECYPLKGDCASTRDSVRDHMSPDSTRSSTNDATMRDPPNGESAAAELSGSTSSIPVQTDSSTSVDKNNTEHMNPSNLGQGQVESERTAGAKSQAQGKNTAMQENGLSSANGTQSQAVSQPENIKEEQFQAFYENDCAGRSKDERLFRVLLEPGSNRNYLIPADFKPLLRALLLCHQGLAFLHATPEFQHRYSETVIERIYFGCTRRHNGRLSLSDVKRSRLLETLMVVDEEEDINRERKYFSYEHFYVLYCRFWELDANHDLQIDREDLMRYGGHSLTYRIVDRIFGGHARPLDSPSNPGYMSYTDFIWFCLSEEDKTSETAIDYWFRCVDLDGDGLITMYDMEFFYKEQLHRMECFGHEPVQIRDILCQLLDMIKPNAQPPHIRRRDLKKCKLAGNFFNVLFNLNKFFALEARDPLQIRQEHATPELTDWDRFAALEYLRLSAEEEGEEEESWDDVGDATAPLMAGEAPF